LEFLNNPRKQQELRLRPFADDIYRSVFGPDIDIERFDNDIILDKQFAIDVRLRLRTGNILLGQEKFLSSYNSRFNSLTVEYMQNEHEQGDWFKLSCQFYFTGYESPSGFCPWVIADWLAIELATLKGDINWQDNRNKDGHAQASFKFVDIDSLPDNCIIAKSRFNPV